MPTSLSLNSIIDITINVSSQTGTYSSLNEFLIIGDSDVIPTSERLRQYESTVLDDMITDGFAITDSEYLAAQLYAGAIGNYFGTGAAFKIWIGRQDTTSPSPAETAVEAVQACREQDDSWYGCTVVTDGLVKSDHLAIAAYIEAASPASFYAYSTAEADVLNGVAANTALTLKGLLRNRTIGMYSSDQDASPVLNVAYPYAIASIMAYAMGANKGLANSAYTLKFKTCPGVLVEPLTTTQVGNLEDANCNMYVKYGNQYSWFQQGVMASGWYFDRLINLDVFGNMIQVNIANLLSSAPKVPLTDPGVTMVIQAVQLACESMRRIGYIAPSGIWTGAPLLNLKYNQPLPNGYIIQAESVSTQTPAERAARQSPPIYVNLIEAGALHSVSIQVNVQA